MRITPDEVHLDTLGALADRRRGVGRAGVLDGSLWRTRQTVTAWPDLVDAVGARRAGWVARADRPDEPGRPRRQRHRRSPMPRPRWPRRGRPVPARPVRGAGLPGRRRRRSPWSAARSPRTSRSRPWPSTRTSSSPPANITVPAGAEWTVDFAQAVAAGLGRRGHASGADLRVVTKVVVVGTRRSVSEEQNATDLAELLTSHRYTDGFALLAAGTPTNNADASRSPYQPTATAPAPASPAPAPSADATALAALLGVHAADVEALLDAGRAALLARRGAARRRTPRSGTRPGGRCSRGSTTPRSPGSRRPRSSRPDGCTATRCAAPATRRPC